MADWFVAKLGRIADTPIASLLPVGHFGPHRGSCAECPHGLEQVLRGNGGAEPVVLGDELADEFV